MTVPDMSGNRWLIITDEDKRGTILVVAIICCIYCPMILGLRGITTAKNIGIDDYLATASTFTGLIQYAIIFAAVSKGLGDTFDAISSTHARLIGNYMIAAQVFFVITICLTKCSVAVLCRRLFNVSMKKRLFVCDLAAILCVTWAIGSIIAVTAGCNALGQIGYGVAYCTALDTRWTGIAITDAITELFIFSLAIAVVAPLQMRVYRKITVLLSFAPRLVIILLAGLHARAVDRMVSSTPSGVSLTNPTVYLQVQLVYGIGTAAVPAVIRSLRMFSTAMGGAWWETTLSGGQSNSGSASRSRGGHIALKSVNTSHSKSQTDPSEADGIALTGSTAKLRPDPIGYTSATSSNRDADRGSHGSTDSQARIIRKEMHWHVRYDTSG